MIIATIFISGGHHAKDSGATSKDGKLTEFKYCGAFRDLVAAKVAAKRPDIKIIKDQDSETLSQYLNRIKTGNGSVTVEFHLDSFDSSTATGSTALVANSHTKESLAMAKELSAACAKAFGIRDRGARTEAQSNRGVLGLTRKAGTTVLLELGFINLDREALEDPCKKDKAADLIADILIKYEDKIK